MTKNWWEVWKKDPQPEKESPKSKYTKIMRVYRCKECEEEYEITLEPTTCLKHLKEDYDDNVFAYLHHCWGVAEKDVRMSFHRHGDDWYPSVFVKMRVE